MKHWWENYPWRMVQMNLREIDMADINAEEYAQQLQNFHATVAMLNAAGIIASYDTELDFHTKSDYLTADTLQDIIDACHRRGIRVIARTDFSKVRYSLYEKHPEWAFRTAKGEIVNYNGDVSVCLNGQYQQEHSMAILTELLQKFPFDGVYCNMSSFMVTDYHGRYYGPCHCDACSKRFREEFQMEIPAFDDPQNAAYRSYTAFKAKSAKEHTQKLVQTIRQIGPEIAINNVDYLRSESATEIDVTGWPYEASSKARRTAGPLRQRLADNASVEFMGFRYRDTSVSPGLMALRQWQNLANAGSVSLYIMGRMDNHLDTSGIAASKPAFAFHAMHEELYCGVTSAARVLLLHKPVMARNDPEVCGWVRALTESHIPFDEMKLGEVTQTLLPRWNVVILPDAATLSPAQAAMLDGYVASGGTLITSGRTGIGQAGNIVLQCLGADSVAEQVTDAMSSVLLVTEKEKKQFPRSALAPCIPFGKRFTALNFRENVKQYLYRVPEHPFGPPERCYFTETTQQVGIAVSSYGEGSCICLPWLAGTFYFTEGYQNTLNILQDVLFELCGLSDLAPELSPMVELTMTKTDDQIIIHLVNTSGAFANSFHMPLPIYHIRLCLPAEYGSFVKAYNGGTVTAEISNEAVILHLDVLHEYEVVTIQRLEK